MTKMEYDAVRQKIEAAYHADLAALERVYALLQGSEPTIEKSPKMPLSPSKRGVALTRSAAMKASWERRRASKLAGDAKGLSPKTFSKFLVKGPTSSGRNGE